VNEFYFITPLILLVVVIVSTMLDRWSVPVILIALVAGIVFGSDVLGWWYFNDVQLTNQFANLALIFILFQGGFTTRRDSFKAVALPAGGLATWGVFLTAVITFGLLWGILRWPLEKAMLLAVIISSTDAAATFSILRRQKLPPRLSSTIEIESAANDPMAILLTLAVIQGLTTGATDWSIAVLLFIWKFIAGIGIGLAIGYAAVLLFNRLKPRDRGHYYVLSLAMVLLTYSVAELAHSSAMLAVFIAGFVMGNQPFVHKQSISNFNSALSTIADICMFVMLGLLVYPKQLADIWVEGIILFLVLNLAARPAAVWLSTLGMGLPRKYKWFISWAGLRGAVPIVLATYPVAAGLEVGQEIFNLVFFVVILSVAIQGSTLGFLAKILRLARRSRPKPLYNLELVTMARSDMDLIVVDIPGPQGAPGPMISDLRLPEGAVITLITRGEQVVPPKGKTHLLGWDQVTVLAKATDEASVRETLTYFETPTRQRNDKQDSQSTSAQPPRESETTDRERP